VLQNRQTIAAVVVTYNRKDLLGQCLDSLLGQSHPLDAIYVIDNHSTDGTCDYLRARDLITPIECSGNEPVETVKGVTMGGIANASGVDDGSVHRRLEVRYVRMPENTGGAGGFHEGMRRASAAGFDWLWLMDDDLLTAPDALEALVRKKDALRHLGQGPFLLNSLVLARDQPDGDRLASPLQELTARGYPKRGVYYWHLAQVRDKVQNGLYRWACPFNGTFVPTAVLAEIGLPNRDFYILGDERDFLWRAARRVAFYTVMDSKVFHPEYHPDVFDWKTYYHIRNMFLVNRHFDFPALRNLRLIVLSLAQGLRHGPRGVCLVLRAIVDGLTGRLGRREDLGP
jgi:rhamnopyranosyl-N-acetylglucosaminyl-diphospho-decaprenol beta-1,3/1,4-galactofuranosyltransferase